MSGRSSGLYTIHRYSRRHDEIHNLNRKRGTIFNPYQDQDFIDSVSIDPGIRNFGLYIERRYRSGFIATIELSNTDLTEYEKKSRNESKFYNAVKDKLDEFLHIYQRCHYVIIEKQLRRNTKMIKLFHFLLTYFMFTCRENINCPLIIELSAKVKTKYLEVTMKNIKKWSPIKAQELFNSRRDEYGIYCFETCTTKGDDMGDTVIQLEAFFIMYGEQITREITENEYVELFQEVQIIEDSIPPIIIPSYLQD